MQFSKLDQYQDNQGAICLRFYFDQEYETEAPQTHYIKIGDITGKLFLSCSLTGGYYESLWSPSQQQSQLIISECCKLVGGEENLRKLIKQGQPTNTGITLAIADNTGGVQWVGKSAQAVTA